MATVKLSANNFFIKGNATILDDGTIEFQSYSSDDYSAAIVSKDVFAFNQNKSVCFSFRADPFTEIVRKPTVWFDDKKYCFVTKNKEWNVNGKVIRKIENENFYVKGSSKYMGLLDGNTLYIYDMTLLTETAKETENPDSKNTQKSKQNPIEITQVVDFDVTDDAYAYVAFDENGNNKVFVVSDDPENPANDVTKANSYNDEEKEPTKVAIGKNIAITTLRNGNAYSSEKGIINTEDSYNQIVISKDKIACVNVHSKLIVKDTSNNTIKEENNVSSVALGSDGTISTIAIDGTTAGKKKYPIEIYQSNGKSIIFYRDGSIDNDTELKPLYPFEEDVSKLESMKLHPILQDNSAFNVLFGVETNNIDNNEVKTYINKSGETTPIIVGGTNGEDNFTTLAKNVKGFYYTKHNKGSDVFFNSKGQNLGDYVVEGANVLPSQLVDFGSNIYKVVVSFTPFGKAIRVFKEVNGSFVEIKAKYVSLEEDPFPTGRVALYIRSVSSFRLLEVEVTDELDTTLLPEEILFRDLDMNFLQTKVAESLNKHMLSYESLAKNVEKQTDVLAKVTAEAQAKFKDLEERVKKLGG